MKRILFIAFPIVLATFACSKSHTCKCVTTQEGNASEKNTQITGTKKKATESCEAKSATYNVIHTVKCEIVK